jgi:hypothetical protein
MSRREPKPAAGERSAGRKRSAQRAAGERSRSNTPGFAALAASGAGRGAAALAGLVGGEPSAGRVFAPAARSLAAHETGVLFAIGGGAPGAVAVLFGSSARAVLLRALGPAAAADPASALAEVANIVASQAVCAIAEGLGARVTLSVPRLVERGAGAAVARALRGGGEAFASELGTAGERPLALLVVLPGAEAPACDTVGA